jgi:AI-2 transport protein TqsA
VDTEQREIRIQTVCLLIICAVAIGIALFMLRTVMVPFVLAIFSALGLSPLIAFQRRYLRLPKSVAILTTFIFGFVILSLLGGLISISLRQLTDNANAYQQQINRLLDQVMMMAEGYGIDPVTVFDSMSGLPFKSVSGIIANLTKGIFDILSNGLLVMLFLFFLLLGGTQTTGPSRGVLGEIELRVQRYIMTKTVVSAATGGIVGGILAFLGVDLALVFGLFAFLLNFIPSIGSIIATLLPLPMVLVNPESTLTTVILAIGLPGLVQLLIGNVIEPKVVGGTLNLHPATVLISLIVWGMIWGIVGMFLAIPLTSVMQIFFERFEHTAPIAELLAGRLDRLQVE